MLRHGRLRFGRPRACSRSGSLCRAQVPAQRYFQGRFRPAPLKPSHVKVWVQMRTFKVSGGGPAVAATPQDLRRTVPFLLSHSFL